MRNIKSKSYIYMNLDEFNEIIEKNISEDMVVYYNAIDNIHFKNSKNETLDEKQIFKKIAKRFNVYKIIHMCIDDNKTGVHIYYYS